MANDPIETYKLTQKVNICVNSYFYGNPAEHKPENVEVEKLRLDIENPRLRHMVLSGNAHESRELEDAISGDPKFQGLMKSIKKTGVTNPLWVSRNG